MQVAKSERNLSRVKLSLLLAKALLLRQVLEELATLNELHDEVDAVGLLEDVVHADNERMVHLVQDEFLDLQRLDRLVLDDHVLANTLHCIVLSIQLVVNQVNFSESSPPNDTDQLEIVPGDLRDGRSAIKAR